MKHDTENLENSKEVFGYSLREYSAALLKAAEEGYTRISDWNDYTPTLKNSYTMYARMFKPEESVVAEKAAPSVAKKAAPKKDIHSV